MRLLIINILATAMLLFGAASASAWSVYIDDTGAADGQLVAASDLISIDVYVDVTDTLTEFFGYAIMYDSTIMTYEPGLSSTASYILYTPGTGAQATTYMVPTQSPHIEWNGNPTPGGPGGQVNINWNEVNFSQNIASGLGVYLATLVFHVTGDAGDGVGEIFPQVDANGWALRVDGVNLPSSTTTPGPGIAVITPEPTTALLVGLGLIGLGVAGRRRA